MTERLHPISMMVFFLFTILLPAFTGSPFFYLLSLVVGLLMLFDTLPVREIVKSIPGYLILFILISCFNPLFYHDGNTVLFYLNGQRITLEALAYGMNSALMVISVLIWCRCFTHYCTGDKIMYLFGAFSPKTAIIISMVLRFVPMYREHIETYRNTQRLLGIYGEGTLFEKIRGEFKIFGGFLSWILEHSMTTSDSMTARGYGASKRKAFRLFSFRTTDALICIIVFLSSAFIIYSIASGAFKTGFYPEIIFHRQTVFTGISYALFTVTAVIPLIGDLIYRAICKSTTKHLSISKNQ